MKKTDSKKFKTLNNNNNKNYSMNKNKNKHLEEQYISKIMPQNNNTKSTVNKSNTNIQRIKTQISKMSKFNNVERVKRVRSTYTSSKMVDKTNTDKNSSKETGISKRKNSIQMSMSNKSSSIKNIKKNLIRKEYKKTKFLKSKTNACNDAFKNNKTDKINIQTEIIDHQDNNNNKENNFNAHKLLDFLISISPIDISKCDDLISHNMNKIIELENKISTITKMSQYEVIKITNDEEDKHNKISTKANLEIINIESKMRKDIYKCFFDFITNLLEQINRLSNNITNKDSKDSNLKDISSSNDLFMNSNNIISDNSNTNSLFISNIEGEFCEKLINITKSFISSDIDLNDLKSNFDNEDFLLDKNNRLFKDNENKISNDDKEFNFIFKDKIKNIHPNEILNKIQNDEKKNKRVTHHHSNSLRVNSKLEKLEEKINKDDEAEEIETSKKEGINLEKLKNCLIF